MVLVFLGKTAYLEAHYKSYACPSLISDTTLGVVLDYTFPCAFPVVFHIYHQLTPFSYYCGLDILNPPSHLSQH